MLASGNLRLRWRSGKFHFVLENITIMQVEEGGRDVDQLHAKIMQLKTAEAVAARQVQEQRSMEDVAYKDALRLVNDKLMDSQQHVGCLSSQGVVCDA